VKRITLAIIFILLSQIIPLLFCVRLMISFNNLFVAAANIAIWLTQPPVSASETRENKSKDKNSVIIILIMSLLCVAVSIVEWAYFKDGDVKFNAVSVTGIILLVIGIIFRALSVQTLGKHFTATVQIKQDHQLITKGPYAVVRHPSYLGAWMAIIGCAVFLHSIAGTFIAFFGMFYAYYVRIAVEEEALLDTFGEKYKAYQKAKARLIPFLW